MPCPPSAAKRTGFGHWLDLWSSGSIDVSKPHRPNAFRYGRLRHDTIQAVTSQNMRDHMSDLELVLVALGETAAVTLGRNRGSHAIEQLLADAQDAGRI